MHVHACSSGIVGGYSGDASKNTAPFARNHSSARAKGAR
jgi:hypothetical protein